MTPPLGAILDRLAGWPALAMHALPVMSAAALLTAGCGRGPLLPFDLGVPPQVMARRRRPG